VAPSGNLLRLRAVSADPLAAYRCSHGHLFLGCPHDDCPEQNAYLARQTHLMDQWEAGMLDNARRAVREALGLE